MVGDPSLFFEGEERVEPDQRGVVASVLKVCTVWISEKRRESGESSSSWANAPGPEGVVGLPDSHIPDGIEAECACDVELD